MSNIESSHWLNLELWEEYWGLTQQLHILRDNVESNDTNPFKKMIENQKSPIMYWNRNKPEISLTFDDGYGPENIKHILNVLRWSWIKATFFILWDCLRNSPELRKQAAEEWHQICCHTFTHIYLSSGEYTDLGDKSKWIKAWPGELNKTDLSGRTNNIKNLLWADYLNKIKSESWEWFPRRIKSDLLLRTEILMREEQMKRTLGEEYLQKFKIEYPFFRFPWGCGASAAKNVNVLKSLWYLSIGWSEDFYKWSGKSRKHMSTESIRNMDIPNGSIPLFHFKWDDYKYIDAYIENMKNKKKTSHEVSKIIK